MFEQRDDCRICNKPDLVPVVSLGEQCVTGMFVQPDEPDPVRVPLDLVYCPHCMFLQLHHTVNSDLMYASYWYRSGTNQTMRDHLKGITHDVVVRAKLGAGDICIDTGCNDGTLLKSFSVDELVKIGFDPSNAIDDIKPEHGILPVNSYFTADNAKQVLAGRTAKVITSISMFYDLDEPKKFVQDIKQCLDHDGLWIVEMNYTTNMVRDLGYDMIGHEHVAYYTLLSFEKLVKAQGLHVNDVTFNSINGGSIRLFVSRSDQQSEAVAQALAAERQQDLHSVQAFADFGARIDQFRTRLRKLVKQIRGKGQRIAAYGASTRGNTVMQHCGFTRDDIYAALDRNPMKWGMEISGCRIPIISEVEGRANPPEYMMILPYYFLDEFIKREAAYLDAGGKFIVYLPTLRIISKQDGQVIEQVID
ncbi:MAG: NarL family transcriptional regulator [Robiginitomaculum sp.]|nr:MAG: NarL family transcriptional regulator [Robiginitomaculum sp.]